MNVIKRFRSIFQTHIASLNFVTKRPVTQCYHFLLLSPKQPVSSKNHMYLKSITFKDFKINQFHSPAKFSGIYRCSDSNIKENHRVVWV